MTAFTDRELILIINATRERAMRLLDLSIQMARVGGVNPSGLPATKVDIDMLFNGHEEHLAIVDKLKIMRTERADVFTAHAFSTFEELCEKVRKLEADLVTLEWCDIKNAPLEYTPNLTLWGTGSSGRTGIFYNCRMSAGYWHSSAGATDETLRDVTKFKIIYAPPQGS